MTCKDCIHNEVCHMREICNDIEEQIKEFGCKDFFACANVREVKTVGNGKRAVKAKEMLPNE